MRSYVAEIRRLTADGKDAEKARGKMPFLDAMIRNLFVFAVWRGL
jgi:hypothetical protein